MSSEALNSIDDYEQYLRKTISPWSPEQRVALSAAMSERWLPSYEAFAAAEEWGDTATLRHALDAVWGHLLGRTLKAPNRARYAAQIEDSTPHMDEFDAPEAISACVMVTEALECCGTSDNVELAIQAMISGFHAVWPEWTLDPHAQPGLWKQVVIRRELRKQLLMLEQVGAAKKFDEKTIATLRDGVMDTEPVTRPRSKPEEPPGITNQAAFEQYRRMIEADLKNRGRAQMDTTGNPALSTMMLFSEWAARYRRRRNTIDGSFGRLADAIAHPALVERQRARDSAVTPLPEWDATVRGMIERCMQNGLNGLDAGSLGQPHGYGPSLRRLWAEAKRRGESDEAAWKSVAAWAQHRPAVWEAEDARKKKGKAQTAGMGERLSRSVTWTATRDPDHPWSAEVAGERWQVRLNDFPDEIMYTLLINGNSAGDFHDWPEAWHRG